MPLGFEGEPVRPLDPDFAAFELDVQSSPEMHDLPLEPTVQHEAVSMAGRLLVSRGDFMNASFTFMQYAVKTLKSEMPVILIDSSDGRYPLDIELVG